MPAPIVLVHGLATSSARTWGETGWLDLLADAGRTTIPVDLPGHGTSKGVADPSLIGDLEGWVLGHLPDQPVAAVGFSLGARVLLGVAAAEPARFERLVVAGVGRSLFEVDRERGDRIARAIAGDADAHDPEAGYFDTLADAPDVDRSVLSQLLRTPRPELTPASLAAIRCPVLVVCGDQDFAGPAEPLVDALPDARLVTLRRTDHFATPKSFDFLDAALDFLGATPA